MKIDPVRDYQPVNLRHTEPRRPIISPILTFLLTIAVAVFIFRAQIIWLMSDRIDGSQSIAARSESPQRPSASVGDGSSPASRARVSRSKPSLQQLATLRHLANTCRFWRRRARQEGAKVFGEAACGHLRTFGHSVGVTVPRTYGTSLRGYTFNTQQHTGTVQVAVPDCGVRHIHGSIAYRQCRSQVKAWLHRRCVQLTQYLIAVGSRTTKTSNHSQKAYCRADRQYMIID